MTTTTRRMVAGGTLALGPLTVAAGPDDQAWKVDAPHTAVTFSVKHFFTPVKGHFDDFDIELAFDREAPENSAVRVSIPVAGLDTGNERRDAHLLSEDFFEAEAHPTITFESESVTKVSDTELLVRGPLRIKGHERQVELPVRILGVVDLPDEMQEAFGGIREVASFEAVLTLDRRDFGVGVGSWAATAVVGKDVEIRIAVEANR
ncbi:MAG: hypothetical protein AMXMBFR53_33930 [Gemmatimonadota bacterium]